MEKSAYNEAELYAYEYYWDAVYNERSAIRGGFNKGLAQGHAEGERDKALDSARRMKADGMSAELITKHTGLDIETVNSL